MKDMNKALVAPLERREERKEQQLRKSSDRLLRLRSELSSKSDQHQEAADRLKAAEKRNDKLKKLQKAAVSDAWEYERAAGPRTQLALDAASSGVRRAGDRVMEAQEHAQDLQMESIRRDTLKLRAEEHAHAIKVKGAQARASLKQAVSELKAAQEGKRSSDSEYVQAGKRLHEVQADRASKAKALAIDVVGLQHITQKAAAAVEKDAVAQREVDMKQEKEQVATNEARDSNTAANAATREFEEERDQVTSR